MGRAHKRDNCSDQAPFTVESKEATESCTLVVETFRLVFPLLSLANGIGSGVWPTVVLSKGCKAGAVYATWNELSAPAIGQQLTSLWVLKIRNGPDLCIGVPS